MNEVSEHSPQALQAVKLLAQYLGNKLPKVWASAQTTQPSLRVLPSVYRNP